VNDPLPIEIALARPRWRHSRRVDGETETRNGPGPGARESRRAGSLQIQIVLRFTSFLDHDRSIRERVAKRVVGSRGRDGRSTISTSQRRSLAARRRTYLQRNSTPRPVLCAITARCHCPSRTGRWAAPHATQPNVPLGKRAFGRGGTRTVDRLICGAPSDLHG